MKNTQDIQRRIIRGEKDFTKLDLTGLRLEDTDLTEVDFSGSNLQGASFSSCIFNETDFSRTNLEDAFFADSRMETPYFDMANLTNATFYNTDVKNAEMFAANLTNTEFSNSKLIDCNIGAVNLEGHGSHLPEMSQGMASYILHIQQGELPVLCYPTPSNGWNIYFWLPGETEPTNIPRYELENAQYFYNLPHTGELVIELIEEHMSIYDLMLYDMRTFFPDN